MQLEEEEAEEEEATQVAKREPCRFISATRAAMMMKSTAEEQFFGLIGVHMRQRRHRKKSNKKNKTKNHKTRK